MSGLNTVTSVKPFGCLQPDLGVVIDVDHKQMPEELPDGLVTWLRTV